MTAPTAAPAATPAATKGAAGSGSPVPLKLAPQLELRPRSSEAPVTTFGRANRMTSRQTPEGTVTALAGSAELRRPGTLLRADVIRYNQTTSEVEAVGDVTVDQGGTRIAGPSLKLQMDTDQGVFESPRYELPASGGRGKADRIEMKGPRRFLLSNATFSTCRPDNEDWRIEARRIDIDQNDASGTARTATLVFQDTSVLRLPVLFFPVGDERKSGVLTPSLSVTSRTGPEVTVPYYFNLAPNYDLTVSPRLSARRGLQLSGDYRYLFRPMFGELRADYTPDDRVAGRSRYLYNSTNAISNLNGWSGGWNVKGVSDDLYFVDYSRTLVDASERSLPRDVFLSRDFGQWNFLGRATRYQNILEARLAPPYERLPQFQLSTYRTDVRGFDMGLVNDVTWFSRPLTGSPEGMRSVFNPSVAYPLLGPAGFVTPKVSLHASSYRLDANPAGDRSISRTVPTFSLDSGVVMERESEWRGRAAVQTLEPRLFYVYTPYRNQDRIPVFDSAANDFNFAQLFTENSFTGNDRIADSNQLTAALVTRHIDASNGVERLRLAVAERFYFDTQRVTIPGQRSRTDSRSDLLLAASSELGGGHSFDSGIQYAISDNRVPRVSATWRYWPGDRRLLNAGVRYQSREYAQWGTSWQWPISARWSSLGKINYSFLQERNDPVTGLLRDVKPGLVEGLLGMEYAEDCWAARFVVQRFVTAEGRNTTAFFFQIDLRGLGRLGADPFGILVRNIPGYRIPDNQPPPSSRFYGYE
ncbi:MAG: LPS-assembly protein LptD [Lautropia sp.]|nr:LPS-assembly protein LptD [Lautropia sp.]